MARERVLVTGGTGFIGRQVLAALAARGGREVHSISRRPPEVADEVNWHAGDLLEPGAAAQLVASIEPAALIHLAWVSAPGEFWSSPENERWVEASCELLDAFGAAGGRRAVVAGTCAEYDWSREGSLTEASTPLRPATPYGAAKLELGERAGALAKGLGVSLAWARLFFLFGPGEHPDRLVATVARQVLRHQPAPTALDQQVRDYLYVGDAGDALAALLDSAAEGAINVASGTAISVAELLQRVAAEAGDPALLQLGALPAPADEPPRLAAAVERLTKEVGWRPSTSPDRAVAETVSWWRQRLRS